MIIERTLFLTFLIVLLVFFVAGLKSGALNMWGLKISREDEPAGFYIYAGLVAFAITCLLITTIFA
jgi:hypothetical protein